MNPLPSQTRAYITQFDALRFFAAITTAIFHGDIFKLLFDSPDRPKLRDWDHVGSHCVTFFFVLSGFLITLLLLREKAKTHTIDVPAFYLRRVLRIWPLYYFILLSGLFVLPFLPFVFMPFYIHELAAGLSPGAIALWLTFFPNLHKAGFMLPQMLVSHTWSIGMEEQFYAVWPWLARVFKKPQRAIIGILMVFAFARWVAYPLLPNHTYGLVLEFFRFDCMAGGGLLAWYFYTGPSPKVLAWLAKPALLYILALASVGFTFLPDVGDKVIFTPFLFMLYGSLLLSLALQPARMPWLNQRWLRYLGQISYGIYMYNIVACLIAINVVQRLGGGTMQLFATAPLVTNIWYFSLVLGLTIGLSALSYQYFEMPFLRLKERFAQPNRLQKSISKA